HPLALVGHRAADLAADVLEPANVVARLLEMVRERLTELARRRRLRQLRQRAHELLLGAVEIRDLVLEQISERLKLHVDPLFACERGSTRSEAIEPPVAGADCHVLSWPARPETKRSGLPQAPLSPQARPPRRAGNP